ncbi:cupin domain-containing protein [Elusimicrobiota bacterium]
MPRKIIIKYIASAFLIAGFLLTAGHHWAKQIQLQELRFHYSTLLSKYPIGNKKVNISELLSQKSTTVNFIQFYGKVKPHYHKTHDEIVVSLSDNGMMRVGEKKYNLHKGSLFFVPKKTEHEARCDGAKICHAYSIFLPKLNPKKPDRIWAD